MVDFDHAIIHPWNGQWPRLSFPAGTTAGHTYVEMRLIPDTDPGVDLSTVRVLGCASSDIYGGATETLSIASGWGIGRHKYLTENWQAFTYTTMSETEIRNNPPPPLVDPDAR